MTAATSQYTLRFPFRLPPGQKFSNLETGQERECGNLNVRLAESGGWYFLNIEPFPDEASANAYIPRVYAGLMWTLLHRGLSPEATTEPQSVSYTDDPVGLARHLYKSLDLQVDRVDSILDGSRPAIYQSDKHIRILTGGQGTLTQGFNPTQSLDRMCDAMGFPYSDAVPTDGKLRIALELFNSFFRETSENARFLTLVMALETLAPEEFKSPQVVELIGGWMSEVRERMATLPPDSDEWTSYDSLEREIGFRREVSIRKRIRSLVQSTLSRHGDDDADEQARNAVSLYDKRGRLVHDGYLPEQELRQSTTQLRELVRRVLEARFVEVATKQHIP